MGYVLDWMKFIKGIKDDARDRKYRTAIQRLALEKAQRESELFDQPIHEEPSILKASGSILGDIAEQRGMGGIARGYKSPVTWGKLAMLKQAGFQPQLSERDVEGLGVEGMYKPTTYAPQYDWFVDEEGNIFSQRRGAPTRPGTRPYQKPTEFERDFATMKEMKDYNQPTGGAVGGGPGLMGLIGNLLGGGQEPIAEEGKSPETEGTVEEMEALPDPVANKGKTIENTETGKRYISDGTKWIETKGAKASW
jgi:hypothetical protein